MNQEKVKLYGVISGVVFLLIFIGLLVLIDYLSSRKNNSMFIYFNVWYVVVVLVCLGIISVGPLIGEIEMVTLTSIVAYIFAAFFTFDI